MISYVLLFIGLLLIYLEFYLPGGILAVLGTLTLITAIILCISHSVVLLDSVLFIVLTLALTGIVIWWALRSIRKSATSNSFYLQQDQEGYTASHFDKELIGKYGITSSDLGPSGFVLIEGQRYQARAQGTYIDKGKKVRIIGGEGAHIIVREVMEV